MADFAGTGIPVSKKYRNLAGTGTGTGTPVVHYMELISFCDGN